MPRGNERWTREKHTEARAVTLDAPNVPTTKAHHMRCLFFLDEALNEIERLSTEIAYLWTAGNITPNPALELAYAVWEQKRCVAEGTR